MIRDDEEFRKELAEVIDTSHPRRPETIEALLMVADWLFEAGELFASTVLRDLAEGRLTPNKIHVRSTSRSEITLPNNPLIELVLTRLELVQPGRTFRTLQAHKDAPLAIQLVNLPHRAYLRETFRALQALPIESLSFAGQRIGYEGVMALASSGELPNLTLLDLGSNAIGNAGVETIATSEVFACLRGLILACNQIGDPGIDVLADSQILHDLETLKLTGNQIGNPGAKALAWSKAMPLLKNLDLRGNPIGPEGRTVIQRSKRLWGLQAFRHDKW